MCSLFFPGTAVILQFINDFVIIRAHRTAATRSILHRFVTFKDYSKPLACIVDLVSSLIYPGITDGLSPAVLCIACGRLSLSVGTHLCEITGRSISDSF